MKLPSLRCIWACLLSLACCVGCSSVGVRVQRDPDIKEVAIQVDVIPITEADKDAWTGTNVSAYWSQVIGGSPNSKATTLQFNPGQSGFQTMKRSPKGISYFVVISDYPSIPPGEYAGPNDPRLCIIPLDKIRRGLFGKRATVKIQKGGIQLVQ
jgi:hypothetical protein